jgi:pimeloyl-ACP methyl ester carboxylesterase
MATAPSLRILQRDPTVEGPGAGRRVVLVHGSMDRATSFIRLMGRLRDWSIVAYDRRGYAGSAATGPPDSFADQVADLVEVLGREPALAFGHSYGGTVVLAAAAAQPELVPAALVWEPPQPWLPWWPRVEEPGHAGAAERAEWFMRRLVGDRIWERLPAATRAQRRAEGHTLEAELTSLSSGPAFTAAQVRTPIIVGRGGQSSGYQRRAAGQLAAELPFGELADIAAAGHNAHLTHPTQVAALLHRAAARV